MARGLVIGEALIDVVERAGHVHGQHVGGSPLNVAVGLARLGRGVDFLTTIGDDEFGRRIAGYVSEAGAHLVSDGAAAARTATARAELGDDGSAGYTFDLDWQLSVTPRVRPPIVLHTGSIAAVREPGCLAVAGPYSGAVGADLAERRAVGRRRDGRRTGRVCGVRGR